MQYDDLSRLDSLDFIKHRSSIDVLDNVPTFLYKTYQILQNSDYSDIVSWTKNGEGFIVKKVKQFSQKVLPLHFRHSNYSSFVRQLNMYDFHKMRQDNQQNAFKNTLFRKGQKHLLKEIQRKDYKKNKDVKLQLNFIRNDAYRKKKCFHNQNLFFKELDIEIQSSKIFQATQHQTTKSLIDLLNFQENLLVSLDGELSKDALNVDEMVDTIMKINTANRKFELTHNHSSQRLTNFFSAKYLKWSSLLTDDKSKEKSRVTEFPSWASIVSSTAFCGANKIITDF